LKKRVGEMNAEGGGKHAMLVEEGAVNNARGVDRKRAGALKEDGQAGSPIWNSMREGTSTQVQITRTDLMKARYSLRGRKVRGLGEPRAYPKKKLFDGAEGKRGPGGAECGFDPRENIQKQVANQNNSDPSDRKKRDVSADEESITLRDPARIPRPGPPSGDGPTIDSKKRSR